MAAAVSTEFVSVGANRCVNVLDWGDNGLIAYCGHRIVCIYDPEAAEVVGTLTGHTGQVNCVKWLPASVTAGGSAILLSGAADNTIRVWAWHGRQHSPPWTCITTLQGHESPVTSLALQVLSQDCLLLASTSADPHLRLWHCNINHQQQQQQQQGPGHSSSSSSRGSQEQLLQANYGAAAWQPQPPVHVGRQIQHCVALATLPEDPQCVLMATGGTDSSVRLYVRQPVSSSSSSSSTCNGVLSDHTQHKQQGADSSSSSGSSLEFKLQCQLKGHENWVKGVAFITVREQQQQQQGSGTSSGGGAVSLLLASAGQDRYGRIWCISTDPNRSSSAPAAAADGHGAAGGAGGAGGGDDFLRKMITRYAPRPHLTAGSHTYWVTLEALLIGHEDWLHSVTWRASTPSAASAAFGDGSSSSSGPQPKSDVPPSRTEVTLLTTSQDRSMMLWQFDAPNELWLSEAAVGDAGASCLGFYGGAFNPRGDQLVAHGFTGALHLWRLEGGSSSGSSSGRRLWVPQHALGGHYGAVEDLAWGADGACLQSVATDQTARLFTGIRGHWFELARTQVHGHDFSCLATIPSPSSSSSSSVQQQQQQQQPLPPACLLYVSGSEEKVLRVFEAPQAFTQSLSAVRGLQSADAAAASAAALAAGAAASSSAGIAAGGGGGSGAAGSGGTAGRGRALGASIAALGLSNKAVYMDEEEDESGLHSDFAGGDSKAGGSGSKGGGKGGGGAGGEGFVEGPDFVPYAMPAVVSGPPLEEHLAQNTLWPEVRKLYGHGNEVFCVGASPSGRVIASACKAQSAGAAAVWVWEVGSWKALAQLSGHTLTVTQLEFSPDGGYLLSGSRDRSFSVWRVPQQYAGGGAAAAEGGGGVGGSGVSAAAAVSSEGCELVARLKSAHSRIIWSVSWSHDSSFFATGSRDQTVKLWVLAGVGQPQQKPVAVLPPFPAGITAVALSPGHVASSMMAAAGGDSSRVHLLAVGMEDGRVQVWRLQMPPLQQQQEMQVQEQQQQQEMQVVCEQLWCSEAWQQHAAAVRRLRWAPACVPWLCGGGAGVVGLASCGEDHSVRLFGVSVLP